MHNEVPVGAEKAQLYCAECRMVDTSACPRMAWVHDTYYHDNVEYDTHEPETVGMEACDEWEPFE